MKKNNNNRHWFNARNDVYGREIKAPMLALMGEVNDAMVRFARLSHHWTAVCVPSA